MFEIQMKSQFQPRTIHKKKKKKGSQELAQGAICTAVKQTRTYDILADFSTFFFQQRF